MPLPCGRRRASYKPDQIRWEDVAHEAADAKMWILDQPDREGRPVVLMRPRREQSQNNDTRLKYLVYTLEKASALADEHAEVGAGALFQGLEDFSFFFPFFVAQEVWVVAS